MTVTERNAKKEMEELARYVDFLRDQAKALGVPEKDAEDLAHYAFIDACNRKESLPECPEQRKALLFKIVLYRVRSYRKERQREVRRAASAAEYVATSGRSFARDHGEMVAAKEHLELICPQMPPEQLELFLAKTVDGLTVREIAARLGIKENTAQSRLERAFARVQAEYERLDKPRHRGIRGAIVFVGISGVLGAASNAHAMVAWLRKYFWSLFRGGTAPLRVLPFAGAVAAILLAPKHPRAVAIEVSADPEQPVTVADSSTFTSPRSTLPALPIEVAPVKPAMPPRPTLVRAKSNKQAVTNAPPQDHLLTAALMALQRGNPEKALAILDGYAARDAGAASAAEGLRVSARQAMAGRASGGH